MADRRRLSTTAGQLAHPEPIEIDHDRNLTPQSVGALNAFMQAYAAGFNGKVSLGDGRQSSQSGNIDGQTIVVLTPATPDEEFQVPHGLARAPIGRIVLSQDLPAHLYDSNRGGWGVRQVFFKCDVASVTFTLVLV
jgi:hypothetical protein